MSQSNKKEFNAFLQRILADGQVDHDEKIAMQEWLCSMEKLPNLADCLALKRAFVSSVCRALRKNRLKITPEEAVRCVDEVVDVLLSSIPAQWDTKRDAEQADSVFFCGGNTANEQKAWSRVGLELDQATRSVKVAAFNLTYNPLRNALSRLADHEVTIQIFADDAACFAEGSDIESLSGKKNITIKLDGPETMMHHKFIIIDDKVAINGSMNFTRAGFARNFENFMIIHNPGVVAQFVEEFDCLWAGGNSL
ncbi:MAG: hypothetical protein BWK76_08230 [Desulfobulbaceae bacterium A2]|nr:MAG: hypothetical protein BWK76_08230 [Desulfobulbaceae bacterium A2]